MPTWEYKCKNGHITEAIFFSSKKPKEIECLLCKEKAKFIYSSPAFVGITFKNKCKVLR